MRLRLLLILLVAFVGMGADCDGGSSQGSTPSTSFASSSTASGEQGGGDFVGPIPEPGAALVFGVGLLIAGAAIRRNR